MTKESRDALRNYGGLFLAIAFVVFSVGAWLSTGPVSDKLAVQGIVFAIYGVCMMAWARCG